MISKITLVLSAVGFIGSLFTGNPMLTILFLVLALNDVKVIGRGE